MKEKKENLYIFLTNAIADYYNGYIPLDEVEKTLQTTISFYADWHKFRKEPYMKFPTGGRKRGGGMRTFQISQFEWAGKRYVLKEPVEVTEENEKKLCVLKVSCYGLHSLSCSGDPFEALNCEFFILYEDICLEDDDNLSPGAIELKNKVLANIERVEEV